MSHGYEGNNITACPFLFFPPLLRQGSCKAAWNGLELKIILFCLVFTNRISITM